MVARRRSDTSDRKGEGGGSDGLVPTRLEVARGGGTLRPVLHFQWQVRRGSHNATARRVGPPVERWTTHARRVSRRPRTHARTHELTHELARVQRAKSVHDAYELANANANVIYREGPYSSGEEGGREGGRGVAPSSRTYSWRDFAKVREDKGTRKRGDRLGARVHAQPQRKKSFRRKSFSVYFHPCVSFTSFVRRARTMRRTREEQRYGAPSDSFQRFLCFRSCRFPSPPWFSLPIDTCFRSSLPFTLVVPSSLTRRYDFSTSRRVFDQDR